MNFVYNANTLLVHKNCPTKSFSTVQQKKQHKLELNEIPKFRHQPNETRGCNYIMIEVQGYKLKFTLN